MAVCVLTLGPLERCPTSGSGGHKPDNQNKHPPLLLTGTHSDVLSKIVQQLEDRSLIKKKKTSKSPADINVMSCDIPEGSPPPPPYWAATSALRGGVSVLLLRLQHVADQVGYRCVLSTRQQVFGLDQAFHQAGFKAHLQHGLHHRGEQGRGSRQTADHIWQRRGGKKMKVRLIMGKLLT